MISLIVRIELGVPVFQGLVGTGDDVFKVNGPRARDAANRIVVQYLRQCLRTVGGMKKR